MKLKISILSIVLVLVLAKNAIAEVLFQQLPASNIRVVEYSNNLLYPSAKSLKSEKLILPLIERIKPLAPSIRQVESSA